MISHRVRGHREFSSLWPGLLILALLLALPVVALAQDGADAQAYRLGHGDELQLSVWQMPELDRVLTVDENGRITVPMIGEVAASGRSSSEVEREIVDRIQVYHRNITRVSIEVTEYISKAFYVLGAVTQPGKYSVWPPPDVWGALREAGGVSAEGDLSRVRIYRLRDGAQVLETIDLEAILARGGELQLPPLDPGETVEVPRRPVIPSSYQGRDGIYVFGEVLRPGVYRLEAGSRDVLGFILQAGGTTPNANLGKVLLMRTAEDGSLFRYEMDLNEYLADADASHNPTIQGGDTIFVPRKTPLGSLISSNLAILTTIATLFTSVLLLRNN
jgi:polysaccharide biosynthesis/export protein